MEDEAQVKYFIKRYNYGATKDSIPVNYFEDILANLEMHGG